MKRAVGSNEMINQPLNVVSTTMTWMDLNSRNECIRPSYVWLKPPGSGAGVNSSSDGTFYADQALTRSVIGEGQI
jgi:hypothetical protein